MKKVGNYLGQLRIYSLVDLWLLLVVAGATASPLWGALLLHIGFLGYLENDHQRKYRAPVPIEFVLVVWVIGSVLFARFDSIAYVALSIIYAKKKTWKLGLYSPFARGLQTLVMVGGICGYYRFLPWLAMMLMTVRNILGDLRDAQEDAAEGKWTIPAKLGLKSRPFAHLNGMLGTVIAWWLYAANLPVWLLVITLTVVVGTYWFTPRRSNKKAAERLHGKIF